MTIEDKQPGELYTLEEIGELLKLSRSTIYRRRKQDHWPHLQIGSEFRFTAEDLEAIQRLYRKQEPSPTPPPKRPLVGTKRSKALARSRNSREGAERGAAQSAESPQEVRKA
ncbi:helix-turn-helix domain-containing protein [Paenarthrobacter sp. NPDC090517]|uniref:helix-turn-helix domain-containing protein n=1 Tax=Paenarthrobacter sp. NPDC090517 TaxID=3364381 RepID=UPI00382ABD76